MQIKSKCARTKRTCPVESLERRQLLSTASFLGADTATQGSWKGVYGSAGYNVANGDALPSAFAQIALHGSSNWTWEAATSDPRALQKANSSDRESATYYGYGFSADLNITDGQSHQVSLYLVDWDRQNRAESID